MAKAPSAKTDWMREQREKRAREAEAVAKAAAQAAKKPEGRHASAQPGLVIEAKAATRDHQEAAKAGKKIAADVGAAFKKAIKPKSSIPKPKKKAIVKELQAAADQAERRVLPPSHPDCERCKELNKRAAGRVKRSRERNKA